MNNENDKMQPRRQISENQSRPSFPSPQKAKDVPPFSKLLCCMCSNEDEPESQCQDKKFGEVLSEMSWTHRAEKQDPSTHLSPPGETREAQISQSQKNRICFHRKMTCAKNDGPSELLSSENSSKKTSDLGFEDARDYFSPSETEGEPEISPMEKLIMEKRMAKTLSTGPMTRMRSILKRCQCETCTGMMRERGNPESYRNSDICDVLRRDQGDQETVIKLDPQLKVVEYDIRSGEVQEERMEEVNLTGEHDPIRAMRNPDVVRDANIRGTRVRSKLKNLFHADRYVEVEFNEDDKCYEADEESEAGNEEDGELNEDDEDWFSEPLTSRDPRIQ